MTHYIAFLVPSASGEWRAVFPDVPDCEAKGASVNDAKMAAATALPRCIKNAARTDLGPKDLRDVENDKAWLAENGVDLSTAVITMIPVTA